MSKQTKKNMKTKQKIIKALIIFVAICATSNALAQNIIYNIGGLATKGSIIREYHQNEYILYNNGAQTEFVYANTLTLSGAEMDISPYLTSVSDMCIKGDYCFFCGNRGALVVMGYFHIPSFIAGTASLNTFVMPTQTNQFNGYTETIHALKKIDVHFTSANDFHMFAIGEATALDPYMNSIGPYRTIIEGYYNGASINYRSHAQYSSVYYFDDLAVVGNELIVVGDKHGSSGQYMHKYSNIASAPVLTISSASIQYHSTSAYYYYPLSEMQIIPLFGTAFATACYAYCDGNRCLVVTSYTNIATIADRIYLPSTTGAIGIRDFAYNQSTDRLGVVPISPGNSLIHITIDPTTLVMTADNQMVSTLNTLNSCTQLTNQKEFMVSGDIGNVLYAWRSYFGNNGCATGTAIPAGHSNHIETSFNAELSYGTSMYQFIQTYPNIHSVNINIICQ